MHSVVLAVAVAGWGLDRSISAQTPAQPQERRLTVTAADSLTGRPLVGALVTVRDALGRPLHRSLANERGIAVVPVAAPFRIRVDAIGYAGRESALLEPGGLSRLSFRLTAAPLSLPDLAVVAGPPTCRVDPEEGAAVSRLWEEARKALTATTLTAANRGVEFEIEVIERELDAGARVQSERRTTRRGNPGRPFRAEDPDRLSRDGYVQRRADGDWYHGPDAELLLSESFLADHCYRLAESPSDRPGLVGLAFAPAEHRTLPDIRGVLWIDRRTAELSHVDFAFDRLDLPDEARGVGGRVHFAKLPNGGWFVDDWHLRMPKYSRVRGPYFDRLRLVGYSETAGRSAPIGRLEPVSRTRVVGRVFDSLAGRPLGGVVVSLQEGAYAGTTGDDGTFDLTSPGTGPYLVSASHPRFEVLGLGALRAGATLSRGRADTVSFAVPGQATLLERLCGPGQLGRALAGRARPRPPDSAAEVWIRTQGDYAIQTRPSARNTVRWRVTVTERAKTWVGGLDQTGRFLVCDLPEAGALIVGVGKDTLFASDSAGPRLIVVEEPPRP